MKSPLGSTRGRTRRMVTVEVEAADLGRRDDVVHARVDDDFFGGEHAAGRRREAERRR